MKGGGFRHLFNEKPVLLRLVATVTRQWIETSRKFAMRLNADLAAIRRYLLACDLDHRVVLIESEMSDRHNSGQSVLIVSFEGGSRIVHKPKDLRLDAAWKELVERLNLAGAPVQLRTVHVIAREGYGWTEFIDHTGHTDQEGCKRFFRRAGAWLALFHCFVSNDMHHENMLAIVDHPVPIDLEMILQAIAAEQASEDDETQAFEVARQIIDNSVIAVGLLPAYGRSPENEIFAIGGMASDQRYGRQIAWSNINSSAMRPAKAKKSNGPVRNLPQINGRVAKFSDHIDDFVAGFEQYGRFLLSKSSDVNQANLFDGFAGLVVRKVIRPTQFYYLLLQRLKDHRMMWRRMSKMHSAAPNVAGPMQSTRCAAERSAP